MLHHRTAFGLASELGWTLQHFGREVAALAVQSFGHGLRMNGLSPAAWAAYFERSRELGA